MTILPLTPNVQRLYCRASTARLCALQFRGECDESGYKKARVLLGTVVNEIGAASNAALVILGDKLGLFRALAEGAVTSAELARKTGTHERYVREWLSAQAAS